MTENSNNSWEQLVAKYFSNSISKDELEKMLKMAKENQDMENLVTVLKSHWEKSKQAEDNKKEEWDKKFEQLLKEAKQDTPIIKIGQNKITGKFFRLAAAAILFIMLGTAYFIFFNKPSKQDEITRVAAPAKDVEAPKESKAMITLANGEKVFLDSAENGTLATQGNVKLVKLANGEITYQTGLDEVSQELLYNTLLNPRGSKVINMTLADGSKVWLNAGSSLTYPVAFNSKERKVSITGEAYFEVTHDEKRPFSVSKGTVAIQVLGTHFNINAYDDEADIKISLLEGAVKINNGNASGILKPGQQAKVAANINIRSDVDMDEVMAWKNGKFDFGEKANIEDIMRQLARWYDLEVEYKGRVTQQFWGSISRNVNASQVFKMLEATGGVTFKMEGKKVIVMP